MAKAEFHLAPIQLKAILAGDIRPLGDRVLIKQDQAEDKHGSLFLPQGKGQEMAYRFGQGYTLTGRVVAKGMGDMKEDGSRAPMGEYEVGDRVVFERRREAELVLHSEDGASYHLIHDEQSIFGVVEG